IDDRELARPSLGRERVLERQSADLLGQVDRMAARGRTEGAAATAELRRTAAAMTSGTAALLLAPLLAGESDLGAVLHVMGAGHGLEALVAHHAMENVGPRLETENLVLEAQRAGVLAVERFDLNVHYLLSPPAALNEPGVAAPFGAGFFTASRIWIQPPLAPGTAPSIMIRPRSTSVLATRTFCVVTRRSPIWPAIFLPLNTLPGSCRWPVEPCERCDTDTPCVARRPWKFQRFIPPAKPLPIEVPVTSTSWPSTKWSACSCAPTSMRFSASTRNSATWRFGSTLATANWPRSALVVFFTLACPAPNCSAT